MKNYIAYLRVSTSKQGIDGLGIAAQENAIKAYNGNVIAQYVEVESGKKSDRPELVKALQHCKLTGSTLIVAKLDRLARNVHFISSLMESGVEFVAVICLMLTSLLFISLLLLLRMNGRGSVKGLRQHWQQLRPKELS